MGKVPVPDNAREQALARMMQLYSGLLVKLCSALLKDAHQAQDIVQETFVKAWQKMDDLRGGEKSEKAWLCRIAVNLCRDYQRTRWMRLVHPTAEPDQPPLWYVPRDEAAADVMEALGQLKPRYREVLMLHYLENLPAEEMGHILGLSASAVYRRLNKARTQLRQLLKGEENDG